MSSRVGTGHVAILPVMTGFKKSVSREFKSAGSAGAKDLQNTLKSTGKTTGNKLGKDLKSAFDSSTKDLGGAGLKVLQRDVASASAALSKARLRQQDDAGKVRVAEAKLQETVAKYGASSSQAIAAEERLEAARRRQVSSTDAVKAASDRLKSAQGELSSLTSKSGEAASNAGSKFREFLSCIPDKARAAGSSIKQHLTDGLNKVADTLRGPATAVVGTLGTGIGVALTSGFGRLTAIDTASKKLKGFGHDAKSIEAIMADATTSVKGTAFGLGEAATVAGAAVAAGIKPGEQLQRHLKTVANNASAAGMSMEEMGSVMNRAATQANGVQNDVIGQLADRGIPIYQELAKELGVTAGEVFKMASEGKIDFETFSRAAEKAAGTVADEMGNTVPGSLKNLMASVGRIGANLLGGIYPKIAPLVQAVTGALGPIEDKAKSLGEVIGTKVGPVIDRLTEWIGKLSDGSLKSSKGFDGLLKVAGPLGGVLLALGSGGLGGLISKIPVVGGMLGGLGGAFKVLGGPIGMLIGLIGGLVATGGDISGFISGLSAMVSGAVAVLPQVIQAVVALVPRIVEAIVAALPQLLTAGGQLLTTLIDGIVLMLPVLVEAALQIVSSLLAAIVEMLPTIIEAGIQLLTSLIQGLLDSLPMLLEAALTLITGLLDAILANLPQLISAGIQLLLGLVDGLIGALPQLIAAALTLIIQLATGLLENLPKIIAAGIQLVIGLVGGLVEAIPRIVAAIPQLIAAIVDGFMKVDWLGLGINVIRGIISGMLSMAGAVWDAIVQIAKDALGGALSFFGIASPSRLMRDKVGKMLPRGIAVGILKDGRVAVEAARDVASDITEASRVHAASVRNRVFSASRSMSSSRSPANNEPGSERGAAGPTYIDNSTIVNPIAEPATTTKRKKAQRKGAGVDGLVP